MIRAQTAKHDKLLNITRSHSLRSNDVLDQQQRWQIDCSAILEGLHVSFATYARLESKRNCIFVSILSRFNILPPEQPTATFHIPHSTVK